MGFVCFSFGIFLSCVCLLVFTLLLLFSPLFTAKAICLLYCYHYLRLSLDDRRGRTFDLRLYDSVSYGRADAMQLWVLNLTHVLLFLRF